MHMPESINIARKRNKIFLLVMAIIFTDTLLYGIIVPLIPVYTTTYGLNSFSIGIIFAVYSLGVLVLSIPFGLVAEKYGYKNIFVVGMLGLGAATLFFSLVASPWLLLLARLLQGIAGAATWTAGLAMVAVLYPTRQGEKLGITMAAMGLGSMLGPPVGGILYHLLGYRPMFIVPAFFCLLLMLLIWRTDFSHLPQNKGGSSVSLADLSHPTRLIWLGLVIVVASGSIGMLEVLLPNYYYRVFNLDTLRIGLIFGAMAFIHAFSDVGIGYFSDRWGYPPFIVAGLLAGAALLPLVALVPYLTASVVVLVLTGIAVGAVLTPSQPLMYKVVLSQLDAHQGGGAGLAYGVCNACFSLGLLVGPILGGALDNYGGFIFSLLLFSAFFILATLALRFKVLVQLGSN